MLNHYHVEMDLCIAIVSYVSYVSIYVFAIILDAQCAYKYFQKQSNGLFWVMRRNFRIPLEEQLRRMVTPEDVRVIDHCYVCFFSGDNLSILSVPLLSPSN